MPAVMAELKFRAVMPDRSTVTVSGLGTAVESTMSGSVRITIDDDVDDICGRISVQKGVPPQRLMVPLSWDDVIVVA